MGWMHQRLPTVKLPTLIGGGERRAGCGREDFVVDREGEAELAQPVAEGGDIADLGDSRVVRGVGHRGFHTEIAKAQREFDRITGSAGFTGCGSEGIACLLPRLGWNRGFS